MRSKVIYYRGDIEGMNGKGKNISNKGQDNKKMVKIKRNHLSILVMYYL